MKTLFFIWACFALTTVAALGQTPTYSNSFPYSSEIKQLKVDLHYGKLHITVANTDKIKVETFIDVNGGEFNDSYEFSAIKKGDAIVINGELDMSIFKNKSINSSKNWGSWNTNSSDENDDREVIIGGKKYTYEKSPNSNYSNIDIDIVVAVYIPKNIMLDITTLYGSSLIDNLTSDIKVNATYGSVDIKCSNKPTANSIDVESTYSTIDLAIPSNLKANFKLKSGYGKIYTDLDINPEFKQKKKECWYGDDITAVLNGGGIEITMESGYSNLYLRKL